MKALRYFVDMRPHNFGKSLHCQICKSVLFPFTFEDKSIGNKCKCTKKDLKSRKVYK